jgi:hypothetical protein
MPKRYLKDINDSKHINVRSFFNACDKVKIGTNVVRQIFSIKQCDCGSRNKYMLVIVDDVLYEHYFSKFFIKDDDSKVSAALKGSSKRGSVNGGILNYFERYDDLSGQSLIFKEGQCLRSPKHQGRVIIIENINTVIKLSPNVLPDIDLKNVPIIYGKGTEISSSQYQEFLSEFDDVICFFDYDIGGLKMFRTLYGYLGSKARLYAHPSLEDAIMRFGVSLSDKQFLDLGHYYVDESSEFIIKLLMKHKKWLEQEVFQAKILGD